MDTLKIYRDRLNACNAQDDGAVGKAFEIAIRSYIQKRLAVRVKPQGKTDIRLTLDGKRLTCEIKTACGDIATAASNQVVIYCPMVEDGVPAEEQGRVFTREEWMKFVEGYEGRGSFTRADKQGRLHIQSFYGSETVRPKASKAIRRYIDEVCEGQPTLEEWLGR